MKKPIEKDGKHAELKKKQTAKSQKNNLPSREENGRLTLAQYLGNKNLSKLLEKDQELIKNLSVVLNQRKVNPDDYLKEFIPYHGTPTPEEYYHKLLEIKLTQGNFYLGFLPQGKKLTLMSAQDDAPHSYQKQVYANRPEHKQLSSKKFRSQNWQDGAVAIEAPMNPRTNSILPTISKFINQNEKKGVLDTVIPFQSTRQERAEKEQLKKIRSRLNNLPSRDFAGERNTKTLIEKYISNKEKIISKKDNKSLELNKKVEKAVELVKEQKINYSSADFFHYLWKKRRQFSEDYKPLEPIEPQADRDLQAGDKELEEVLDSLNNLKQ